MYLFIFVLFTLQSALSAQLSSGTARKTPDIPDGQSVSSGTVRKPWHTLTRLRHIPGFGSYKRNIKPKKTN